MKISSILVLWRYFHPQYKPFCPKNCPYIVLFCSYMLLCTIVWPSAKAFAQQPKPQLLAGPIPMHTTDSTLTLWLLAKEARQVMVQISNDSLQHFQQTQTFEIQPNRYAQDFVPINAVFTDLKPETNYAYKIVLDTFEVAKGWVHTLKKAGAADFSFLFGSCNFIPDKPLSKLNIGIKSRLYKSAAQTPADFMLWLGDNCYYRKNEWESGEKMFLRNVETRLYKPLQKMLGAHANYAVWDDHDFGPNNADSSYPKRDTALWVFKQFWANPTAENPNIKGTFFNFCYQDAEFFVLDNRYYRSPKGTPNGSILGKEQLNWLLAQLKTSTATFKFIAGGVQFLNDNLGNDEFEGMAEFSAERQQIFDFLEKEHISGVIFLSGDRHFAELYQKQRPNTYPLWEVTSSAINSMSLGIPFPTGNNPLALKNTKYWGNNYCSITLYGPINNRQCRADLLDVNGRAVWTYIWSESELK